MSPWMGHSLFRCEIAILAGSHREVKTELALGYGSVDRGDARIPLVGGGRKLGGLSLELDLVSDPLFVSSSSQPAFCFFA